MWYIPWGRGAYRNGPYHSNTAFIVILKAISTYLQQKRRTCHYTSHSNVYKITEGCFVHKIGKRRGLAEIYEFPTLCLVFLCPSMERKSLVVSLTKAIFWCKPATVEQNRGLSWKLSWMLCHRKPSHCPISKVIPPAAPPTKWLPC